MPDSTLPHFYLGDEDLGVLDETKFSLSDSFVIKAQTGGVNGLTPTKFFEGIQEMDPTAIQALVWFLRFKKNPNAVPDIHTIDFAFGDLRVEVEPNPLVETSGKSDAATSGDSPTSSD